MCVGSVLSGSNGSLGFGKIGDVPLKEYNFGDVPLKERFFASYHRKVETLQVITIPSCSATKSPSFYFFSP